MGSLWIVFRWPLGSFPGRREQSETFQQPPENSQLLKSENGRFRLQGHHLPPEGEVSCLFLEEKVRENWFRFRKKGLSGFALLPEVGKVCTNLLCVSEGWKSLSESSLFLEAYV